MRFQTQSSADTKKIAADMAVNFSKAPIGTQAVVIALQGDLGAGKTTFTQGFATGLGIIDAITSPTFVLMKQYPLTAGQFTKLVHIDCYRLNKAQELVALGFQELLTEPQTIIMLEWPERVSELLPKDAIWIKIDHTGNDTRTLEITP